MGNSTKLLRGYVGVFVSSGYRLRDDDERLCLGGH